MKIAAKYPQPCRDTIVEPFAGSAAYSLHGDNWRKNVILIEKDERVFNIWKWLQTATPKEIWELPFIEPGKKTTDYNLPQHKQDFVGYWIAQGASTPNLTPGKFNGWHESRKLDTIANLCKIKHWTILNCSYEEAPDVVATWFIDPPYKTGGQWYRVGSRHIDYSALATWARKRKGQVMVCENGDADWMDFVPLTSLQGQRKKTMEIIWYRENNNPDVSSVTRAIQMYQEMPATNRIREELPA